MRSCPIGLDCSFMPRTPGGNCKNRAYCRNLTKPWPLPYTGENGYLEVIDSDIDGFRPAERLPFKIKKDGLYVTRTVPDYYAPVWHPAEELQYTYNPKSNRLVVRRNEPGFYRAWPLSSRKQHEYYGKPLLDDRYPRPNNWKFKKELLALRLKLADDQKPIAYFRTPTYTLPLWAVEHCDRL